MRSLVKSDEGSFDLNQRKGRKIKNRGRVEN